MDLSLAANLRQIQGETSLTAFAELLGYPRTTVRLWLIDGPGGTLPIISTVYDIARTLGVSPHWLMTGEGPESMEEFKAALHRRGA